MLLSKESSRKDFFALYIRKYLEFCFLYSLDQEKQD